MTISNDNYEIAFSTAPRYSVNSADNKHYDLCINSLGTYELPDSFSCYEADILCFETGKVFSVCLLCPLCTRLSKRSVILSNNTLLFVSGKGIIQIDLGDMSYLIHEISNPVGVYYDIYPCQDGFLLYGELELIMLDGYMCICWRYFTKDLLYGSQPLQIHDESIEVTDYYGSCHVLDITGQLTEFIEHEPTVISIDVTNIRTPREFQAAIKCSLQMPDFYGLNWDAYWDAITGLISLPDELILKGWHIYKQNQPEDAAMFESVMRRYNAQRNIRQCECVYVRYKS